MKKFIFVLVLLISTPCVSWAECSTPLTSEQKALVKSQIEDACKSLYVHGLMLGLASLGANMDAIAANGKEFPQLLEGAWGHVLKEADPQGYLQQNLTAEEWYEVMCGSKRQALVNFMVAGYKDAYRMMGCEDVLTPLLIEDINEFCTLYYNKSMEGTIPLKK